VKTLLQRLGPGFVTGTSDDDPAAIGTYIQAGAQFQYGLLWTALFTTPIMYAVQEMSGRIGLVTGRGLGSLLVRSYSWPVVWFIVAIQVITNTINLGADLGAMAQSIELVWNVSFGVLLAITALLMVALITLVPYKQYADALKFLGLLLLSYVVAAFTVHVDWGHALRSTVIPHVEFTSGFILTFIAVLGVTISPYEFFWQSNEEVEELLEEHKIRAPGF
jgi:NRAMP (natural resistance-associated macrophage protein)-like metal ion transporter